MTSQGLSGKVLTGSTKIGFLAGFVAPIPVLAINCCYSYTEEFGIFASISVKVTFRCHPSGDQHVRFGYLRSRPMHGCRERAQFKTGACGDNRAEARLQRQLEKGTSA